MQAATRGKRLVWCMALLTVAGSAWPVGCQRSLVVPAMAEKLRSDPTARDSGVAAEGAE